MDYMLASQNKRRLEADADNFEKFHLSKRLCNGLESCNQVGYGAVAENVMESWEIPPQGLQNLNTNQTCSPNMVFASQGGRPTQVCSRCMAGESGHINHIMGC